MAKKKKTTNETEKAQVCVTRSRANESAGSLYDFKSESPELVKKTKRTGTKAASETKPKTCKNTRNGKVCKEDKTSNKRAVKRSSRCDMKAAKSDTPLTFDKKSSSRTKRRHLRSMDRIPPPNLDDISPIVHLGSKESHSKKMKVKQIQNAQKQTLRSSDASMKMDETPSISFMESQDIHHNDMCDKNDSGLFLSPRKTMPRFSSGTTSTPASLPVGVKSKKSVSKVLVQRTQVSNTNTSTPDLTKPKRSYTRIKEKITKLSPVQPISTPTSDYGSMESFLTPSPTPAKQVKRKKRASSPAFTLDDDTESLSLNKSIDKGYLKTKKRITTSTSSRQSASRLDEWAEKVNSELEDLENFELSVEG